MILSSNRHPPFENKASDTSAEVLWKTASASAPSHCSVLTKTLIMENGEEENLRKATEILDCNLNSQISLYTLKWLNSKLASLVERCNRLLEEIDEGKNLHPGGESVRITMHPEEEQQMEEEKIVVRQAEHAGTLEGSSDPQQMKTDARETTPFDDGLELEEDLEDEIDIVVEEDGQIIKISSEEMKKLRSEFEENRLVEEKEKENLQVKGEDAKCADYNNRKEESRYNLDPKYAGRVNKGYICKVCDLEISSRRGLESHVGVNHPGLSVFRCRLCLKKFASDVGLILHMQNKHPPSHLPTLTCPEPDCKYATHGRQLLRAHLQQHRESGALQCPVCNKTLTGGPKAFRHHMKLHAGDRAFPCPQCDKSFVSQSRLTYHRSTVHDPPKFQCDQCSKLFRSKVNFTRHLLVHSNARPHVCHICQAAFRTPGHLTSHVQTVHRLTEFTAGKTAKEAKLRKAKRDQKEEEKGRKEAEGYLRAAGLCLEDMQALENREAKVKSRKEQFDKRETDTKRGRKRVSKGGNSAAPQIVTLTNEKGDLIKAIISVGEEEQVEEEVVVEETRVLGNSRVEEPAQMVVVAAAEETRSSGSGDAGLIFQTSASYPDIVYVMDNT